MAEETTSPPTWTIQQVQQSLLKNNYDIPTDLAAFKDKMTDPVYATKIHTSLVKNNYDITSDPSQFISDLGLKKKGTTSVSADGQGTSTNGSSSPLIPNSPLAPQGPPTSNSAPNPLTAYDESQPNPLEDQKTNYVPQPDVQQQQNARINEVPAQQNKPQNLQAIQPPTGTPVIQSQADKIQALNNAEGGLSGNLAKVNSHIDDQDDPAILGKSIQNLFKLPDYANNPDQSKFDVSLDFLNKNISGILQGGSDMLTKSVLGIGQGLSDVVEGAPKMWDQGIASEGGTQMAKGAMGAGLGAAMLTPTGIGINATFQTANDLASENPTTQKIAEYAQTPLAKIFDPQTETGKNLASMGDNALGIGAFMLLHKAFGGIGGERPEIQDLQTKKSGFQEVLNNPDSTPEDIQEASANIAKLNTQITNTRIAIKSQPVVDKLEIQKINLRKILNDPRASVADQQGILNKIAGIDHTIETLKHDPHPLDQLSLQAIYKLQKGFNLNPLEEAAIEPIVDEIKPEDVAEAQKTQEVAKVDLKLAPDGLTLPSIQPQPENALPVTPDNQLPSMQEGIGQPVNYQGIEGKLGQDAQGNYVVHDADGNEHLVEGGLSGQQPHELGLVKGTPIPEPENIESPETKIPDNQIAYDHESGNINLYGKDFKYLGVESDPNGNTTAIRVQDANGKQKYIRNQDAILEIEIQKELAEIKNASGVEPEDINKIANENDIQPTTEVKNPNSPTTEPIQQEGSIENPETSKSQDPEGLTQQVVTPAMSDATPHVQSYLENLQNTNPDQYNTLAQQISSGDEVTKGQIVSDALDAQAKTVQDNQQNFLQNRGNDILMQNANLVKAEQEARHNADNIMIEANRTQDPATKEQLHQAYDEAQQKADQAKQQLSDFQDKASNKAAILRDNIYKKQLDNLQQQKSQIATEYPELAKQAVGEAADKANQAMTIKNAADNVSLPETPQNKALLDKSYFDATTDPTQFLTHLSDKQNAGELTQDQVQNATLKVQQYSDAINSMPDDYDEATKRALAPLLIEKNALLVKLESEDPGLPSSTKDKINDVQKKIEKIAGKPKVTIDKAGIMLDGKRTDYKALTDEQKKEADALKEAQKPKKEPKVKKTKEAKAEPKVEPVKVEEPPKVEPKVEEIVKEEPKVEEKPVESVQEEAKPQEVNSIDDFQTRLNNGEAKKDIIKDYTETRKAYESELDNNDPKLAEKAQKGVDYYNDLIDKTKKAEPVKTEDSIKEQDQQLNKEPAEPKTEKEIRDAERLAIMQRANNPDNIQKQGLGISNEDLKSYAKIAASYIREGITDTQELIKKLREDFGDLLDKISDKDIEEHIIGKQEEKPEVPEGTAGIKNRIVNPEMEAMGIKKENPYSKTMDQQRAEGKQIYEDQKVPALIDDLIKGKKQSASAPEIEALRLYRQKKLDPKVDSNAKELRKAQEDKNVALIDDIVKRDQALNKEYQRWFTARNIAASPASQTLAMFKGMTEDEYSLAVTLRRASAAHLGLDLTPEQHQFYMEAVDHFNKTVKDLEDYQEAKKQTGNEKAAQDKLNKESGLAKRTTARKGTIERIHQEREDSKTVISKLLAKQRETAHADIIPTLPTGVYKEIAKIATGFVHEGIVKLADVVDRTLYELKDIAPDITSQHIISALSGDYPKELKTQTEIQKNIADVKKQAQLTKKLDNLENGVVNQRSIKAKGVDSQEVADLKAKIMAEHDRLFPKDTTEAITAKRYKTYLQNKLSALQDDISNGNYEKPEPRPQRVYDAEELRLKTEIAKAKGVIDQKVYEEQKASEKWYQKVTPIIHKIRMFNLISSPLVFAKVLGHSVSEFAVHPLDEAGEYGLRSIFPGLNKLSEKGKPTVESITQYYKTLVDSDTYKDVWTQLSTYQNPLEQAHGLKPGTVDDSYRHVPTNKFEKITDSAGNLHAAEKLVLEHATYRESYTKRVMQFLKQNNGEPLTDEQMAHAEGGAMMDALEAIMRNRTWGSDKMNAFAANSATLDATMKILTPIRKIPLNIARQIGIRIGGLPYGLSELVAHGIKNLAGKEMNSKGIDDAFKHASKGSIGALLFAVGVMNPNIFGGYYDPNREDDDVSALGIKGMAPWMARVVSANPLMLTVQMGATLRRNWDNKFYGEHRSPIQIAKNTAVGVTEEIPFVNIGTQLEEATGSIKSATGFTERLLNAFYTPTFVGQVAGITDNTNPEYVPFTDKDGHPIKRQIGVEDQKYDWKNWGHAFKQVGEDAGKDWSDSWKSHYGYPFFNERQTLPNKDAGKHKPKRHRVY